MDSLSTQLPLLPGPLTEVLKKSYTHLYSLPVNLAISEKTGFNHHYPIYYDYLMSASHLEFRLRCINSFKSFIFGSLMLSSYILNYTPALSVFSIVIHVSILYIQSCPSIHHHHHHHHHHQVAEKREPWQFNEQGMAKECPSARMWSRSPKGSTTRQACEIDDNE